MVVSAILVALSLTLNKRFQLGKVVNGFVPLQILNVPKKSTNSRKKIKSSPFFIRKGFSEK